MAARIQGLASLQRKLKALPKAANLAIAPAMEAVAKEVVALARSLASASVDTGDLQLSINWTWGEAPKGSIVIGKVKDKMSGNLAITIFAGGDNAFWARWVEFGTAPHINGGLFAGTQHPGTKAQPFFYPAWRARRRSAKNRISRAITKSARAVAAGGNKP